MSSLFSPFHSYRTLEYFGVTIECRPCGGGAWNCDCVFNVRGGSGGNGGTTAFLPFPVILPFIFPLSYFFSSSQFASPTILSLFFFSPPSLPIYTASHLNLSLSLCLFLLRPSLYRFVFFIYFDNYPFSCPSYPFPFFLSPILLIFTLFSSFNLFILTYPRYLYEFTYSCLSILIFPSSLCLSYNPSLYAFLLSLSPFYHGSLTCIFPSFLPTLPHSFLHSHSSFLSCLLSPSCVHPFFVSLPCYSCSFFYSPVILCSLPSYVIITKKGQ